MMSSFQAERVRLSKSLACLLHALQGSCTTIELRSEITVRGRVHHVESCMNIVVTEATSTKLNGESSHFEQMFIRGAQIRYVHIPDEVDVMATIVKQTAILTKPRVPREAMYQRQRVSRSKLERIREEREMARSFKLGRGRARHQLQPLGGPTTAGQTT